MAKKSGSWSGVESLMQSEQRARLTGKTAAEILYPASWNRVKSEMSSEQRARLMASPAERIAQIWYGPDGVRRKRRPAGR